MKRLPSEIRTACNRLAHAEGAAHALKVRDELQAEALRLLAEGLHSGVVIAALRRRCVRAPARVRGKE